MRKRWIETLRRHELYLVTSVIGIVFVSAMALVAWMLQSSIVTPPYEALNESDLRKVFATAYLRFREDDRSPYLKVELHNGTLWWIKRVEFDFEGLKYSLRENDAFRPLHFGAVRCPLRKVPQVTDRIEFDLKITKASGYPPAQVQWERESRKFAGPTGLGPEKSY
ncbi:hypothetical protein [Desulfomonile tiedjei]|uniref:Uncharacterized protein n=1 Tax=Desulfomonile tiedjei (strain ATCC 49306 / DSM 6799 / DCB-1) TaxID=706587 RepID=I4C9Z0_DESTA|nr:hypothetical protein [Desulfomonile tiedjei]AFM26381.1 hypothetical protein Desti_3737 [Desulfomonile tiedjei DSM 6799]